MTAPAYRCWFELIDVALNPIGWGYDHWLFPFCSTWQSLKYKAGIVDEQFAVHGASNGSWAAALEHTYGRKVARDMRTEMQRNFRERGISALHNVDRGVHGWLFPPPRMQANRPAAWPLSSSKR